MSRTPCKQWLVHAPTPLPSPRPHPTHVPRHFTQPPYLQEWQHLCRRKGAQQPHVRITHFWARQQAVGRLRAQASARLRAGRYKQPSVRGAQHAT
jgi:hypothetical protein